MTTHSCIKYTKGWKYQLAEDYSQFVTIRPAKGVATDYIRLGMDGRLTVCKGYAWDGASGPAFDTETILRASLVHDALYQLMGMKLIDLIHRKAADEHLYQIARESGMSWARAQWVYRAVRLYGKVSKMPEGSHNVLVAS